jgi:SAM-dependent methyltransferase
MGFDRTNQQTYERKGVVDSYVGGGLMPGEKVLLDALESDIAGRRILDMGVGAARTTPALMALSSDYVAIDYSQAFVDLVRERFGLERVYCMDARDMARFASGSFDFVLFSYNGLDYVDRSGRTSALREIHRVLAPGGVFMFSSHNLDASRQGVLPWQRDRSFSLRYVKECIRALAFTRRRRRLGRLEQQQQGWALLNDEAHNYSLLTYYGTMSEQQRELAAAGFGRVSSYDADGTELTTVDSRSPWLYYVARRDVAPQRLSMEVDSRSNRAESGASDRP